MTVRSHFYMESKIVKLTEAQNTVVVAGDGDGGNGEMLVENTKFQS